MINAQYEEEFIFHDGTRAKNILELARELECMSNYEFHTFVNYEKNDFANWIASILSDSKLAEQLRQVMSREETISIIKDRISELTVQIAAGYNASTPSANTPITQKIYSSLENHAISPPISLPEPQKSMENSHVVSGELKASRNWFNIFSKKSFSKNKNQDILRGENPATTMSKAVIQEDKIQKSQDTHGQLLVSNPARPIKSAEPISTEEVDKDTRENALWLIMYISIVLLIIILLVYKFVI